MKTFAKVSGKRLPWEGASPDGKFERWIFEHRPGGWVIATRNHDGKIERIRFFYQRVRKAFWAKVHGLDFYGERLEESSGSASGSAASDYSAQFPGKVRKILVQDGSKVAAGTALLMVEAMKMEFAIKSNAAGTVKKILVQEGQQLTPGQLLVDFAND